LARIFFFSSFFSIAHTFFGTRKLLREILMSYEWTIFI
jgi:hypothetical protein